LVQDFRRFTASTQAIDQNWSTCPCSGDAWTATGIVWGTNNGPIQVKNGAGVLGVQKPGHSNPTNPHTAATEKVVADLAYHLNLPVPPATLWDRGAALGLPRYVVISAWACDNVLSWDQAQAGLSAAQRDALLSSASAMLPFESWISADDRQNGGNVLIAVDAHGDVQGAWIDYAFSLDHLWKGNLVPDCGVPALFPPIEF
jgi:hypothetical protein